MSLCTWRLQYRKLQVMFKVSPASLHTFTDTQNCVVEDRVQYSTVHIPSVFCDGHLQIINCMGIFLYCNLQVHTDFLINLCNLFLLRDLLHVVWAPLVPHSNGLYQLLSATGYETRTTLYKVRGRI
jgi:hypothetical protein